MHVHIVGFKCHIDVHYDFENGNIILLKGPSGVGKSTILQCIYWCLYGNMRNIYNNAGITRKLSVTLSVSGLLIHRKKNPELLKVQFNDKSYEDIVAQQIINSKFGTKELWKSCSYIDQKARCDLLSGSTKDRMKLLNKLSFDDDDPKEYITRISDKLKAVKDDFTSKQTIYTTSLDIYTKELNMKPINPMTEHINIVDLTNEVNQLKTRLDEEHSVLLAHERCAGSYNWITEQIQETTNRLNNVVILNKDEVESNVHNIEVLEKDISLLEDNLKHIIEYETKLSNINSIKTKLDVCNKQLKDVDIKSLQNITSEYIWNVQKLEEERGININKCKSLNCEYDEMHIEQMKKYLEDTLNYCKSYDKHVPNYNKLKILTTEIDENMSSDQIKELISTLEKNVETESLQLENLKKGLELLSCPNCSESLRYANGKLYCGDRKPVTKEQLNTHYEKYKSTIRELEELRNTYSKLTNVKMLKDTIDVSYKNMEVYLQWTKSKEYKSINTLYDLISKINSIKYIDKPIHSSKILKIIQERENLKKEYEKLIESIDPKITTDSNTIYKNIKQSKEKLNKEKQLHTKNQKSKTLKDQLSQSLIDY